MSASITVDLRSRDDQWIFTFPDGRQTSVQIDPETGYPVSGVLSPEEQEDLLIRLVITSLVERRSSVNTLNGDTISLDLARPQPSQWLN